MSNTDEEISIRIKDDRTLPADSSSLREGDDLAPRAAPKLSLTHRALFLQGLVFSASAIILIYLIFSIQQFLQAQSLHEAAQQQRIYNQRFAKEVLLADSGVPVSYEKTAREWLRTMDLLTRGGELPAIEGQAVRRVQPSPGGAQFKETLGRLSGLRNQIVEESTTYLQSAKLNHHRAELFDELYRQSLEFEAAGDALVNAYDKHLDSGVSWWDVNAVAVELAERQRMLIQQHIKEVLFVARGIPADYQTTRLRLYETLRILIEGGSISIDNKDAISIPPPGSEDIRFNLNHQKSALDKFTAVSNQLLMLANEDVERSIMLKKLSDMTTDFHDASTDLLAKYNGFFEGRVRRASRDAVVAGLLALLFVLLLTRNFIRKYAEIPLKNIIFAVRGLRVSGSAIDPVEAAPGLAGEAVFELNAYIQKQRGRERWFDQFLNASDPSELPDPGGEDAVASRVYQWHRNRITPNASANRWNTPEENGLQIVGRLPDVEPTISDSDLLDDLLQRANDLQSEQERLAALNRKLTEEAAAWSHVDAEHRSAKKDLQNENTSLRIQLSQRIADYESLSEQVRCLRLSEGALQAAGSESSALFDQIKGQLIAQENETRALRAEVELKRADLARAQADIEALKNEARQAAADDQEARLNSLNASQQIYAAKDAKLALLTRQLEEAEQGISKISADLERSVAFAADETRRREEAMRQIAALSTRAEANAIRHSEAGEQIRRLSEQLKAEAFRHEEAMRQIAELKASAETEAGRLQEAVHQNHEVAERLDRLAEQSRAERLLYEEAVRQITAHKRSAEAEANRYQEAARQIVELKSRVEAETIRHEEVVRRITAMTEESQALGVVQAEQIRKMDSTILDAQREHARALEKASAIQAELEARGEEQLRKIQYQQELILQLQRALADQTSLLEGVRSDFAKASELQAADLRLTEQLLRDSQEALKNGAVQNNLLEHRLEAALEIHEQSRKQIGEFSLRIDEMEVELWQLRRELAERNAELENTRLSLAQESDALRFTREEGVAAETLMRAEINRLKALVATMENDFLQEREQLQSGLKSTREAFREKCQALASAEERLSATRVALKSSLDELQEKLGRTA